MSKSVKRSIESICVRGLFGLYDYDLPSVSEKKELEEVMILYGNNGSGKSTILKVLFHLLSTEEGAGHKSYVASVKFQSFEVYFSDGLYIGAIRPENQIIGSFNVIVKQNSLKIVEHFFQTTEKNIINYQDNDKKYEDFMKLFRNYTVSIYFLPDDRNALISEGISSLETNNERKYRKGFLTKESFALNDEEPELTPEQILLNFLYTSISRTENWIRQQVMRASTKGDSDVNSIYVSIINNIADSSLQQTELFESSLNKASDKILKLNTQIEDYAKYGLIPPFNGLRLLKAFESVKSQEANIVSRVLMPYLTGLEARLKALNSVQKRIDLLISTLNVFFVDKRVSYSYQRGIQIFAPNGERLKPTMLSSGEKHLLLLFCNTIPSLDKQRVIIIDEPEISLNITWQRILVKSLLDCVSESQIQYVFASHSMEILSQHLDKVVKLESKITNYNNIEPSKLLKDIGNGESE
ncbi:MAG: ATP-binding protein [Ignavibacteriales bacterium]|nr:MAG: ATP-binding protein [Ignavibacteriales bacterium]